MPCQDFLPADIQTQFAISRELIRNIYNSFYKLRDRAERIASRAIDNAADLLIFGKELRQVTLSGSAGGGCRGFCRFRWQTWRRRCIYLDNPPSDPVHSKRGRRGWGKWESIFRRKKVENLGREM